MADQILWLSCGFRFRPLDWNQRFSTVALLPSLLCSFLCSSVNFFKKLPIFIPFNVWSVYALVLEKPPGPGGLLFPDLLSAVTLSLVVAG